MIWPFLFALLVTIFFVWRRFVCKKKDKDEESVLFTIMLLISILFGILVPVIVGFVAPKHWVEPKTTKLVSLRDGGGISGHFFLGVGSIQDTQYYFFYKEVGQGYQPGKVVIDDNVMVFEEKRQDGELRVYSDQFVNPLSRWIAIDIRLQKYKYEFIIPEGSLKKSFVLL